MTAILNYFLSLACMAQTVRIRKFMALGLLLISTAAWAQSTEGLIVTNDDTDEQNGQMIIKGGEIDITVAAPTADCLKADNLITISGGTITLTTTGNGARSPEEGFDCDNYSFVINGGTAFGVG